MPTSSSIPQAILNALKRIEPDTPDGKFYWISSNHFQSASSNKSYFAKEGSASEAEQYHGEAESLRAMYTAAPGICPKVLESSIDPNTNQPVFISEYKHVGSLNTHSAKILGKRLAEMHLQGKSPTDQFGFEVPTYCGATRMANGWYDTWAEAYSHMIGELLDELGNQGRYEELCKMGDEVRARYVDLTLELREETDPHSVIPRLLGEMNISPAILHGDLWSGNAGTDENSQPVIYDPSSYYGHNEADLSIARIFGGFPPAFFIAYHERIPRSEPIAEYDQRAALYELFHYLNHTVLFGRSYESSAKQKMKQLLRYISDSKTISTL